VRLKANSHTLAQQAKKGVLRATLIGRSYAVTGWEVERYRREHLGQRTGFHDPTHPMHGKRGGGRHPNRQQLSRATSEWIGWCFAMQYGNADKHLDEPIDGHSLEERQARAIARFEEKLVLPGRSDPAVRWLMVVLCRST